MIFHVGAFTGAVPAQLLLGFWGVVLYGSVIALLMGLAHVRREASALFPRFGPVGVERGRGRECLGSLLAAFAGGLVGVLLVGPFAVVGYLVCGWGEGLGKLLDRPWPVRRGRYSSPIRGKVQVRFLDGALGFLVGGSAGGWAALALLGYPALSSAAVGLFAGLVGMLGNGFSPEGGKNLWIQLLPSLSAWWVLG
jgi:dolichol kinase